MFFGITPFAGLVTSVVTVAGLAVGSAVALAEPTVYYKGAGLSVSEVQVSGQGLRTTFTGGTIEGQGIASAQPKVEFLLQGSALAEAIASGYSRVDFAGYGSVLGESLAHGKSYKRTRVYPGIAAGGEATGYGDTVSYVYAEGSPAIGSAKAIGTTWHVVRATVVGEAIGLADATRILGVRQRAEGESFATATAFYQVGFSGVGLSEAYAMGDAAVRIQGVLHHAGNGKAVAESHAVLSHVVIYQPQRAESEAVAQGQPQHTHGAKGRAVAECLGLGSAIVGQTGVSWVRGEAAALGYGNPTRFARAKGTAVSLAQIQGYTTSFFNASGSASSEAYASGNSSRTAQVEAVQVTGEAQATATGIRTVVVESSVVIVEASAYGYNQINDLVHAPEERTLVVEPQERLLAVEEEPRVILV